MRILIPFLSLFLFFHAYAQTDIKIERQVKTHFASSHLVGNLYLFDYPIDLLRDDIRERFEREFFWFLDRKGFLHHLIKLYMKCQKLMEEEIRKQGGHPDLIFLLVAESHLNPRALSSAGASGLWQFMRDTAKEEGLIINEVIDERYDIIRSTRVALTHLKKLYSELNDWYLAASAYNAGIKRVREALQNQNARDFFDLFLPEETERYIFRIAALKEIITNRERYGIRIDDKERYGEMSIASVTIRTEKDLHTSILASSMELPYRQFRYLNLHIRKYVLPKGTYNVYMPQEKKSVFLRNISQYQYILVEPR